MNFQEAFFDELEKIAERRSLNKEAGARSNLLSALLGLGALAGTANIAREGFKHPGPSGVANIATTLAGSKDSPPLLLRRPGTPGAPKPFKKLGEFDPNAVSNVLNAMDSAMPGHGPTDTLMAVTKYYGPRLKGAGSKISDLIKKLVENKKIKI
jgi:hypothetical protein